MGDALRILVVDDDESLRGILASVLEDDGYLVTTAVSGEEALVYHLAEPFPLIVTDIRMGGMSGIELLQKLKEINVETEVVVMTSYASVDTALTALRLGAYDYLIKPFDELEFISNVVERAAEKIRLIFDNRRMLDNLLRNRTELEQLNQSLQELAVRDGLTGLYNRRYLQEVLEAEARRCIRSRGEFSLVFLDVDHFKKFNDRFGHPEGDMVLKVLAGLLVDQQRKSDVVARFGGEEIMVLLPETSRENGIYCAQTICSLVAGHEFFGTQGQSLGQVTISIGVAAFPKDGVDLDDIMRRADEALYAAKSGGRNRVCTAVDREA